MENLLVQTSTNISQNIWLHSLEPTNLHIGKVNTDLNKLQGWYSLVEYTVVKGGYLLGIYMSGALISYLGAIGSALLYFIDQFCNIMENQPFN